MIRYDINRTSLVVFVVEQHLTSNLLVCTFALTFVVFVVSTTTNSTTTTTIRSLLRLLEFFFLLLSFFLHLNIQYED